MTWLLTMLGVVVACAGVDYLWVRWQQAIADRRAWVASGYSVSIRLASSLAVLVLVADHRAVVAAALGDGLGTWLAVRFAH